MANRPLIQCEFGNSAPLTFRENLANADHSFKSLSRYLDRKSHADLINLTDFGDHDIAYFLDKFEAEFRDTHYPGHYAQMMGLRVVEQPIPEVAA